MTHRHAALWSNNDEVLNGPLGNSPARTIENMHLIQSIQHKYKHKT
jgi:hypothetical protein